MNKSHIDLLCKCGCGDLVSQEGNRFIRGHNIRINNPSKLPEIAAKISKAMTGRVLSKEFREKLSHIRKGRQISEEQRRKLSIALKGRTFSKEHRQNLSIAASKRKLSNETKHKISIGCQGINRGDKNGSKRLEVRARISASRKGKRAGSAHPLWKGGISVEPYGPEFNNDLRSQVRKRDRSVCQICRKPSKEEEWEIKQPLTIHHIDLDKKNHNLDNLITLCCSCHSKLHWRHWEQGNSILRERNL